MTILQELLVKFVGDTKGLEKAFGNAKTAISAFSKVTAGATAVLNGGLALLAIRSANAIDAQRDLALSLGVTYQALEDLSLVASEAGIEQNSLAQSLGFMQRNLIEAASGTGAASDALARLGISAKELLSLTPDQQFAKIAGALSNIENPALKTAIAMDIFGRSGRQLIPMLNDFSEASENARAFNERFGLSLTTIQTAPIDAAGDSMGRVGKVIEGVGNLIALETAPYVQLLAEKLIDLAPTAQQSGGVIASVFSYGAKVIDFMSLSVKALAVNMLKIINMVNKAAQGFKMLADMIPGVDLSNHIKQNQQVIDLLDDSIKKGNEQIGTYQSIEVAAKKAAEAAKEAAKAAGGDDPNKDKGASGSSPDKPQDALEKLKEKYKDLGKEAKTTNEIMADGLQNFADEVINGADAMDSLRKVALQTLRDIINNISGVSGAGTGGLGSILGGVVSNGLSSVFKDFNLGSLSMPKFFAKGGVVNAATAFPLGGGMGVMGEAGAEAIMPLARGSDGKLGVKGGGGATVNQTIVVQAGVSQTVAAEMNRMMPNFRQLSEEAIRDAQQRGRL